MIFQGIIDFLTTINGQMLLIAYLAGAIPFGLILAKVFAKVDIRESGSKSIGATNVLRVVKESNPALAKKLGIATVVLDALKGVFVLFIGEYILELSASIIWAMAVLAVVGHCFSPFLKFEGGKGVATSVGVLAYLLPLPTLIAIAIWGISAKTIKISSVSSLLGLSGLIVSSYILYPTLQSIHSHAPLLLIAFLVVYKHVPNIIRLVTGQEKRVV